MPSVGNHADEEAKREDQDGSEADEEGDPDRDLENRLYATSQAILRWHGRESRWFGLTPVMPPYIESEKVGEFYQEFGSRVIRLRDVCKKHGLADPELDQILGKSAQTMGDVRLIGIRLGALAESLD